MQHVDNNTADIKSPTEMVSPTCGFGVSMTGEQKWPARLSSTKQLDLEDIPENEKGTANWPSTW